MRCCSLVTTFRVILFLALAVSAGCAPRPAVADTAAPSPANPGSLHQREQPLMGTRFHIQVIHPDPQAAAIAIDAAFAEVARVETLISEWRPTSDLSRVNDNAGAAPTPVAAETWELFARGRALSELTDGAFDMTFAACGHLWSVSNRRVPAAQQVTDCLPLVNFREVELDEARSTVFLQQPGMRAGSGAIGKGFGVDAAAKVLDEHAIEHYAIDGGGDLKLKGTKLGKPWVVGVAHPRKTGQLLGTLELSDVAVVTSGDYQRYFEVDGVRHHHIIDPNLGKPADRSIAVTLIAADATTADALATGMFVLGPARGLAIANSQPGVEALIVAPDLSLHMTDGFAALFRASAEDRL